MKNPSIEIVEEYIQKFKTNENYYLADQAIVNLFETFPYNNKIEDIILKVSVLNSLYSTNIYSIIKLATYILSLNIDERLQKSEPTLVENIAVGHKIKSSKSTTTDYRFYSFATKYCHWHVPNSYPMYDSYVEKTLITYRDKIKFAKFKNIELKDFSRFKEIINAFRKVNNLEKFTLKEIDKFLWMYGKELF